MAAPTVPAKSSTAMSTLLVVMVLVLAVAIMYLFTRIRKQDQNVDRVRKENQQQLQDQDVVQIVRQFVNSPGYQSQVQKQVLPVVDAYCSYYHSQQQHQSTVTASQHAQEASAPHSPQVLLQHAQETPTPHAPQVLLQHAQEPQTVCCGDQCPLPSELPSPVSEIPADEDPGEEKTPPVVTTTASSSGTKKKKKATKKTTT